MLDDLDSAYARTVESGVDLDAARSCHLYRIDTWNHEAFMRGDRIRERGYIGESQRTPLTRLSEHLGEQGGGHLGDIAGQPWADLYCGQTVDDRVFGCKREVLAAEQVAVERERPRYNVEWNRGNPNRTPPWKAVEERHERDRMLGRPLWQPPRPRAPRTQPAQRAPRAAPAPRAPRGAQAPPARRTPLLRRNRWPWRFGGWLVLSLLLWVVAVWQLPFAAHLLLLPAAAGAAAPLVGSCPSWRGRAGWKRRTCKRVATLLCAVAVVAFLYAAGSHIAA